MDTKPNPAEEAKYAAATRAREFEIDLFWKRSLFFWGFQAAAFVALATASDKSPRLGTAIASFGFVCAAAWTMANRGSKFWYESWEKKLQDTEVLLYGRIHSKPEPTKDAGQWLSAKRYSVSRLAIGLSYYAVAFWLVTLGYELIVLHACDVPDALVNVACTVFALASVVYAVVLERKCYRREQD